MIKKMQMQRTKKPDAKDRRIAELEAALSANGLLNSQGQLISPVQLVEAIERIRLDALAEGMQLASNSPIALRGMEYFILLSGIHSAAFCENGPTTRLTLKKLSEKLVTAAHNLEIELEAMGMLDSDVSTDLIAHFHRIREAVKKYELAGRPRTGNIRPEDEKAAHDIGTTILLDELRKVVASSDVGIKELYTSINEMNKRGRPQSEANAQFRKLLRDYSDPVQGEAYLTGFKIYQYLRGLSSTVREQLSGADALLGKLQTYIHVDGKEVLDRRNLGVYTMEQWKYLASENEFQSD